MNSVMLNLPRRIFDADECWAKSRARAISGEDTGTVLLVGKKNLEVQLEATGAQISITLQIECS